MAKKIFKESFSVRAIMILLVVLLISLYISSGYLAKYTSSSSDDAGARISAFSFDINNSTALSLDLSNVNAPGTSQAYTFTVNSPISNETSRSYTILIKNTNNLPLTLTLTDATPTILATTTATAGTGIAYDLSTSGNVAPGAAFSKTYTLTVAWPAAQNLPANAGKTDAILLEVTGEQLD